MSRPTTGGNGTQTRPDGKLPQKRQWQAPLMTTYKAVSETQEFTGLQPGDGINNNSG